MDWNEDGRKDLLTGENVGYVRIYLNTNTDEAPVFNGYSILQIDNGNFDVGSYSSPDIVDWNNDGKKDVICGDSSGRVTLIINLGTNAAPQFSALARSFIQDGTTDLDAGTTVSPVAVDLNRDGKKDLIVGESLGRICYYENRNTDAAPVFEGYSFLKDSTGATIDVVYYARVCTADWDNDGIIDVMSGNRNYDAAPSGGVWFFKALGPLAVDATVLSRSMGGDIDFAIDAGTGNGGRNYFLMGTGNGTSPGTVLPGGAILPLNWGNLSWFIFNNYNTYPLTNFRDVLDSSGQAIAELHAAAPPLPAGLVLNFAFTTEWPYDFQSNPVSVEVVP